MNWLIHALKFLAAYKHGRWFKPMRSVIKLVGCSTGLSMCLQEGVEKAKGFMEAWHLPGIALALALGGASLYVVHSIVEAFEICHELLEVGHLFSEPELHDTIINIAVGLIVIGGHCLILGWFCS